MEGGEGCSSFVELNCLVRRSSCRGQRRTVRGALLQLWALWCTAQHSSCSGLRSVTRGAPPSLRRAEAMGDCVTDEGADHGLGVFNAAIEHRIDEFRKLYKIDRNELIGIGVRNSKA